MVDIKILALCNRKRAGDIITPKSVLIIEKTYTIGITKYHAKVPFIYQSSAYVPINTCRKCKHFLRQSVLRCEDKHKGYQPINGVSYNGSTSDSESEGQGSIPCASAKI